MDHDEPIPRFRELHETAVASGLKNPNAMVLASVDARGRPWSRVVLLKDAEEAGFVFYTNLESRKGTQILAHPAVSLNFYWRDLEGDGRDHQVVVEGEAELVADDEADRYFATRPRGSQLGAWASRQSRELESRARLLAEVAKIELRFPGKIPRPDHWSGFRVVPWYVEFWREGRFRLHDRIAFEREGEGWRRYRLSP